MGQQTAREAVVATAEFSSPEGLLGASHGSLAVLLTAPGGNETPGVNDDSLWLLKKLARMPPQLEKNHVVPTAWQVEALARDGVSREVPCSALKGDKETKPCHVGPPKTDGS